MVKYKIKVKDSSGNLLGEFPIYRNLSFGKRLSNYGEASFEVPVSDTRVNSLVALRQYTIEIHREEDGVSNLVWAGEQALRKGTLDVKKNNWAEIFSYTWFEQLSSRYTTAERIFTGVDQGLIAWTLIDETQSDTEGDLGITEGTIEETIERDRKYYNNNIMEMIINLSNVLGGFDFEITDLKAFNAASVIGVDRTDSIVLRYGVNIQECTIVEDFTKPVNRAIVLGEATGEDNLQRVEREDAPSMALYGLREDVESQMDVSEIETLEDTGDAMLRKYKSRLFKVDAKILPSSLKVTDFALGDMVRLIIQDGVYDIDETYRIFEYSLELDALNKETLKLVLGNFTL